MSIVSSRSGSVLPLALALVLFGAGCSRSKEAPPAGSMAATAPPAVAVATPSPAPADLAVRTEGKPLAAGRALVVTVEMSLTAKNPDVVVARLRDEVERAGGFVADASASGAGEMRSARVVLRVPAERTRGLRALAADLGTITNDTEKSEDVTEQRADLEARLTNARTQEKRLVEIMGHKTGSVGEVLEVERELGRVRETIERFDAQKRALDGKIDLATVTVNVTAPAVMPKEEGAWARIAGAFRGGLDATRTLALYAAMAFAALSPVLVPVATLAGIVVVAARRRRRAMLAAIASHG